jgi:16S rRNA (guanine527-N7)-methyltransferase
MAANPQPLTPESFRAETGVSRETLRRLETYASLLGKWQRTINLVGAGTLEDMWRRHYLDSAQLAGLVPPDAGVWIDLGTGAGLPGMVLAILGVGEVHLVESNQRKCAFLAEVARATDTRVKIHAERAEDLDPLGLAPGGADVVTARAVAPLSALLRLASRFGGPGTTYLVLAGRDATAALTEARKSWTLSAESLPSKTDPDSVVLRIRDLALHGPAGS